MITLRALMKLSLYEFLRDRVVWIGLAVAFLLFAFSLLLGALSFNEKQRILAHIGWSAIQLSTLGMSLLISANWLHKEMDRQTCLIVLARPVSRTQFFLGKYLAILALTLILQFLLATLLYFILESQFSLTFYSSVFWGTFIEVATVFTACFVAATAMRPILAFVVGTSVFLIGHWTQEIQFFGNKVKSALYIAVSEVAEWSFPNLYQFNWRSIYFLENGVSQGQIIWATFHSLAWILFLLSVGSFIFRRKDLV